MRDDFKPGSTYKIEYESNGQFKNIRRSKLLVEGAPPTKGASYPKDEGMAERIFVCGALNAMLNNSNVNPMEISPDNITSFVDSCRLAWNRTFGRPAPSMNPKKEGGPDDMSDEIPW